LLTLSLPEAHPLRLTVQPVDWFAQRADNGRKGKRLTSNYLKQGRIQFDLTRAKKSNLMRGELFLVKIKQLGLYFPDTHFSWLLKHGMFVPFNRNVYRNYFSPFQLPILDMLYQLEVDSLEYPISKNPFTRKGITRLKPTFAKKNLPITWQTYFKHNKSQILLEQKYWYQLVRILHEASALQQAVDTLAEDWFTEDQASLKMMSAVDDARKSLIQGEAYALAKQIMDDNPDMPPNEVRNWATSTLPLQIIKHNPLYLVASTYTQSLQASKDASTFSNTSDGTNHLKVADFYASLIDLVRFYFRCLGEKPIPSIERLTSMGQIKKKRLCSVCGDEFIPRGKGRKNILCEKDNCHKIRDRQQRKLRWSRRSKVTRIDKMSV
jgi:hypothetical protein